MKVLFIDIDTLRPDHMGCYGYRRDTTPNIDKIAEDGIRFNSYYTCDAPCLPSRASLISGQFGIHHGAVGHGGTAGDRRLTGEPRGFKDRYDENNLWNVFRRAGMYTASISTFAERHSSYWFNGFINEVHNVGKGGGESGEEVLPVALDWLERNRDRDNWMLHLHLWDPHTPYRAPADFGNPFEDESLDNWITDEVLQEHLAHVGPHSINEINMFDDNESDWFPRQPGSAKDLKGVKRVFDGYDCGIRYADFLLGKVFDKLKELNIYDDTAIIVTSDHGENMGELGLYSEHATADYATCRIPMIIKWDGVKKGSENNGLHYNIDLVPTVAELLKVNPAKKWDGESYAPILRGEEASGRPYVILSQMAHVCQRSVRFDKWLYMRTYHDGLHLFDKEMLFDIENDPHEQINLAKEKPEICEKAAKILLDWFDDMMCSSDYPLDPMQTVLREGGPLHARNSLDKYCARLETTGRSDGAQELKRRRSDGWHFTK